MPIKNEQRVEFRARGPVLSKVTFALVLSACITGVEMKVLQSGSCVENLE